MSNKVRNRARRKRVEDDLPLQGHLSNDRLLLYDTGGGNDNERRLVELLHWELEERKRRGQTRSTTCLEFKRRLTALSLSV